MDAERIEGRLATLESGLAYMNSRSDERMDFMRERFDRLDKRLDRKEANSKWLSGIVLSLVLAGSTSVYGMLLEPMITDLKALDRKVVTLEKTLLSPASPSEPK